LVVKKERAVRCAALSFLDEGGAKRRLDWY